MDDAALAADLMTASYPALPQDPVITAYRWAHMPEGWESARFIAELERHPIAYLAWLHGPWEQLPARNSEVEVWLDRDRLDLDAALARLGYGRDRMEKVWELDLNANGERLLKEAAEARAKAGAAGIRFTTLAEWDEPQRLHLLHDLDELTKQDIPHTLPILPESLDDFEQRTHGPDKPPERYWIALHDDRPVALSFLRFPPVRGCVWTGYTCSHPDYRGRGLARAIKLQSLAQAVELGVPFVYTDNDSENAPMLHINERLGYRRRPGFVNLLKRVEP